MGKQEPDIYECVWPLCNFKRAKMLLEKIKPADDLDEDSPEWRAYNDLVQSFLLRTIEDSPERRTYRAFLLYLTRNLDDTVMGEIIRDLLPPKD